MKNALFGLLVGLFQVSFACDITADLLRPVHEKSLSVFALLALAENQTIVDQDLFYDELCKASLYLCKEVLVFTNSGYFISSEQGLSCKLLVELLRKKCESLPIKPECCLHMHAVETILRYTNFFLETNMSINADL